MDTVDALTVMLTLQMTMLAWLVRIEKRLSRLEGYIYKLRNDSSSGEG